MYQSEQFKSKEKRLTGLDLPVDFISWNLRASKKLQRNIAIVTSVASSSSIYRDYLSVFKLPQQMDDLVDRATSEALTAEDWSLIISICEQAEGYYLTKLRSATKAKETVQALTRRIAHKNVNVVLYSLTLANALVQNCSLTTKQQIASRDFLKELQRILASKCHVIVKDRILDFIKSWAEEMKDERSLDYMGEVYRGLLSEGAAFPKNQPPSPKKFTAKDREEEDLQLAVRFRLIPDGNVPLI